MFLLKRPQYLNAIEERLKVNPVVALLGPRQVGNTTLARQIRRADMLYFDLEDPTRRYLDMFASMFLVRELPPWFENLGKRQVKSPKAYIRDSGLLNYLLGLETFAALEGHPKLGASWEGFALKEVLRITGDRDAYFWATHTGRRVGFAGSLAE